MKIIFFSIFVLRLRICSRHKCRFYAECGQLLRESGQLECWDGDGKRKELGGYDGNEKGWFVVCVRDYMEGVQSEIVGEAASCSVLVQTSKSGMVWG